MWLITIILSAIFLNFIFRIIYYEFKLKKILKNESNIKKRYDG